jgi:hypothetical protein
VLDLEADCQSKTGLLNEANSQGAKLVADNMKLYEKIRYLQSIVAHSEDSITTLSQPIPGGSGQGIRARGAGPTYTAVDEDFEKPYNRLYAESLDPFIDFGRREKARRYANLSAAEKITLTSSRLVLANKFARTIVFIYVVVLHVLVFATLWHFGHVSHRGCFGDHSDHFWDGATLGAPVALASTKDRLIARLMPNRLRGGSDSALSPVIQQAEPDAVSRFAEPVAAASNSLYVSDSSSILTSLSSIDVNIIHAQAHGADLNTGRSESSSQAQVTGSTFVET